MALIYLKFFVSSYAQLPNSVYLSARIKFKSMPGVLKENSL